MLSVVAEQVRQFLSTFVTDHVFGNVLVWPARVVVSVFNMMMMIIMIFLCTFDRFLFFLKDIEGN